MYISYTLNSIIEEKNTMELMMLRKGVIKIIEAAQKKNYKIVKDGNAVTITKEFSGDHPRVSVTMYRDGSYVRNGPFLQNFPIRTLRLIAIF